MPEQLNSLIIYLKIRFLWLIIFREVLSLRNDWLLLLGCLGVVIIIFLPIHDVIRIVLALDVEKVWPSFLARVSIDSLF